MISCGTIHGVTPARCDIDSAYRRGRPILELNNCRDVVGFIDNEGPMSTRETFVNDEGDWEGHLAMSHLQVDGLVMVRRVLLSAVVHEDKFLSLTNNK